MVIIAGETGSGKTTQIPKICLELGRGVDGQIGHTQPRRLAARTVAERIAEELGSPLGETVGYKVRFTDVSADDTLVKLMTDGILLTELTRDRDLRRYDTLIIDEAHERSLNIDFILGYLRQLLPRRPDLKVIITSATIDPERFAAAFSGAPIVEVSGRTYPVRGAVPADRGDPGEDGDQGQAISDAVDELSAEGPGDILVFLSGEREIRDTADLLAGRERPGGAAAVLPAFRRRAAQGLPAPGRLQLHPPGGAGHQRGRDLAHRPRHQVRHRPGHRAHLQVQPPDQGAAAADRADLAGLGQPARRPLRAHLGRDLHPAVLAQDDFESRPEFTDPEILRTNLASVILQMAAIGLGDVPQVPVHRPARRPQYRRRADPAHRAERVREQAGSRRWGASWPGCPWTRASAG